jgi:molybdenum cofactor cytidylyltransferase
MKAIAIILAAGESKRMGVPKALLEAEAGITFLSRLTKVFAEAGVSALVVVGAHAGEILAAHPTVPAVINPHWRQGQLSSVYVGLRAALSQGAERILVHPVDTPMIASATAAQVLAGLEHARALIPSYQGATGHPLGLTADAARTLLGSTATTLEEGAAILGATELPVDDPLILDNLNTPEAYSLRFGHNSPGV